MSYLTTRVLSYRRSLLRSSIQVLSYHLFTLLLLGGLIREDNEIAVLTDRDIYNLNFTNEGAPEAAAATKVVPFIHIA